MANNWFTAYGLPQTRGGLSSAEIRTEFARISAAFDRMPAPAGGSVAGFSQAYLDAPTADSGLWRGGAVGTGASPTVLWASSAYAGGGAGGLVSTVLSDTNVPSGNEPIAVFRMASTTRTAFAKRVGGTTPRVSFFMDDQASLVMGDATTESATTATTGFFYLPTVNGAPTGVPTAYTGAVAAVVDRANNRLYIRNGASWRYVALT